MKFRNFLFVVAIILGTICSVATANADEKKVTSSLPVHSSFLSQDDSVKVSVSPKTEVYVDDGHVYTVVEVTLDKNPLIVRSHDGSVHIHFEPTADYFKFDQNPKAYYGFDGYIKRSDGTYAKQTVGGNGRNNNQGDGFDYTWSFWNSAVNQYDRLVFKVGIILKNGYEDYIDKSGKLEIPFKVNGEVIQNDVGTHNYISLGAGYIQFHVSKPVVVKYVDEDGNDIYKSQTITGKYGDTYDASTKQYMPDIDGYTLDKDKLPSNQVGIISDQDQVVTYVYKRDVVSGGNVTFKYQDENGKKIDEDIVESGNVGDKYQSHIHDISGYIVDNDKIPANDTGRFTKQEQTVIYVYKKASQPTPPTPPTTSGTVIIHFVDKNGNKLVRDKVISGKVGEDYHANSVGIDGYRVVKDSGNTTGKFKSEIQEVTYTYEKQIVVKKGAVIYSVKKIGLYSTPNFSESSRIRWYHKKARINRPMFVVTGYAISRNGHLRYKVRDVNHHSKTAGKRGFVTANNEYVLPVYYAGPHRQITIINPKGANAYDRVSLTGKMTHYKQGQVLNVVKIVHYNLTTRFILKNGKYITANKKLVIDGTYRGPQTIWAKTAVNRYDDVNLTRKNHHFNKKSHHVFKVLGWDYSHGDDFSQGNTRRYRVSGGYVTANNKFVSSVKK